MQSSSMRFLAAVLLWCSCWFANAADAPSAPLAPISIGTANAVPLHGHGRFWIDDRGDRTIEQVEAAGETLPWRVLQQDQQQRLDGKAMWVQFDLLATERGAFFLEIAAPSTDLAQLLYRDANGAWVRQQAGENLPVSSWPVPGRIPAFELALADAKPTRYWLRIEHARADFVPRLWVYRDTALLAKRAKEQLLFGAYFGLAGLVAFAALVAGVAYRDRAFLVFSLYVLFLAFGQLARVGIGAQHLWPDWQFWNEAASSAWPGLPTAAALWFVKVVTEPARLSRALDLGVWALIAALLGSVALDMVIATRSSMFLVLLLTGLSLAAILSMVVWGWLDGRDRNLRLVALAFA
ncbi:MAG TPA: 7TM diverse intracellular signaling domain-containing protein, partial [Ramlibacter sp.]